MYHWRDNIFFGRKSDGGVRMIKLPATPAEWPKADGDFPDAEMDIDIPKSEWISIICCCSHRSETSESIQDAEVFHG